MNAARLLSLMRFAAAVCALALAGLAMMSRAHADTAPASFEQTASPMLDSYQIGSGDKLRVIVYGEDDLGGTFDVDGGGYVSLPLVGQVKVGGLTAHQVERNVTDKLADGFLKQPRVNIEVTQYRPFYVIGEVNRPGQYPYVNDMNVLNAVAVAGGYTQKAIESGFYLRRNGETKEEYLKADPTAKIYPGDVIRIDSSPFWDVISVLGPVVGFASLRGAFP